MIIDVEDNIPVTVFVAMLAEYDMSLTWDSVANVYRVSSNVNTSCLLGADEEETE